ncbi:MAG: type VII toxin-antitoxin system HepT family RNase toxin [Candidatus Humimicrobiaceae bacterium]
MVEKELIKRKLSFLEEYYNDLQKTSKELDYKKISEDKIVRRFVERTLQIAIESCLDIAQHIISYEKYREPVNNQDMFQILIEENILDKDLGENLKKMAQFRNVIVHEYIKINPEIIFSILKKNLPDISKFSNLIIKKFISDK